MADLPAISGPALIALLRKDGWTAGRVNSHVQMLTKMVDGRVRTTCVSLKRKDLPAGTLAAILGPKQSCIGREGLAALIKKHGA